MTIVTARWTSAARTTIEVVDDEGLSHFVPADEANADYRALIASGVEVAEPA